MNRLLVLVLVCLHLPGGAEGFDLTAKPHVGVVGDAGSTPAASTIPQPARVKPSKSVVRVSRAYRTPVQAKLLVIRMAREVDTPPLQIRCLINLWNRESRFNPSAYNRRSGAGGIPQIIGLNPEIGTEVQIRRGFMYINARYKTPCRALRHHDRHGWY